MRSINRTLIVTLALATIVGCRATVSITVPSNASSLVPIEEMRNAAKEAGLRMNVIEKDAVAPSTLATGANSEDPTSFWLGDEGLAPPGAVPVRLDLTGGATEAGRLAADLLAANGDIGPPVVVTGTDARSTAVVDAFSTEFRKTHPGQTPGLKREGPRATAADIARRLGQDPGQIIVVLLGPTSIRVVEEFLRLRPESAAGFVVELPSQRMGRELNRILSNDPAAAEGIQLRGAIVPDFAAFFKQVRSSLRDPEVLTPAQIPTKLARY